MQAAQQQASEPTPEQQFLAAETEKAQVEAAHTAAEIEETQASTSEKRANAAKTLADIDREAQEVAIAAYEATVGTGTASPQDVSKQGTMRP